MDETRKNNAIPKLKVLISPLNWGIGHATRCIPIIRELVDLDCEVFIAAEGKPADLLKNEFPDLTLIASPPLKIRYSSSERTFFLSLLISLPRILMALYEEHKWIKKVAQQYQIDLLISDNRPALYNRLCKSVYITHQLNIKTKKGSRADKIASTIHRWFINHFDECWIPDFEGDINLAGELSHNGSSLKIPIKYLGCLSRFEKSQAVEKKYCIAAIISGPEPQRTLFEKFLLEQLKNVGGKKILLRGLPGEGMVENKISGIDIINHANATELSQIIQNAELIICRSGYTSLMDLTKLGKKAVLVPTPGQPEQEYLAARMKRLNLFYVVDQDKLSLQYDINEALKMDQQSFLNNESMMLYKKVLREFILSVRNTKSKFAVL